MREVELRMNEQLKYEIIKDYVDRRVNKNQIALKLSIIKRMENRYLFTVIADKLLQKY